MAEIIPFRPRNKQLKLIKRTPIKTDELPEGDIAYSILYDEKGNPTPILEALSYDALWALFIHYLMCIPQWAYQSEMFVLQWITSHARQSTSSKWLLPYTIEDISEDTNVDEEVIQTMFWTLSNKQWIKESKDGYVINEQLIYPRIIQDHPGWHRAGSVINGMNIGFRVL